MIGRAVPVVQVRAPGCAAVLLRQRGVLVTANLNHGGTANAVCQALLDPQVWLTAFVDDDRETAISIKL